MTNQQVAQAWKNGQFARSAHCSTDGERIYSYALCVGITDSAGRKIGLNVRAPYSVSQTTSTHVGLIAQVADRMVNPRRDGASYRFPDGVRNQEQTS